MRRQSYFRGAILLFKQTLNFRRVVDVFKLARCIRRAAVRKVKVVTTLIIRQIPRATTSILTQDATRCVMANREVAKNNVVLYLSRRDLFPPITYRATKKIIQIPIICVVSPLTNRVNCFEIRTFSNPILIYVNQVDRRCQVCLVSPYFTITAKVTVQVEMFLVSGVRNVFNRIYQVPNFVRSEFPWPCAEIVTIAPCRITSVTVGPLYGFEDIVPRLPSQYICGSRRPRFIAYVRGNKILETIDVPSSFRAYIT